MNLNQINKFRMMGTTGLYLEATPASIITKRPAIATVTVKLADLNNKIKDANDLQESAATGEGKLKSEKHYDLFIDASSIAKGIYAYASSVGNTVLAAQMKKDLKRLDQISDTTFLQRCRSIHDNGVANVASLAPFGVTAPLLTALKSDTDAYEILANDLRNKVGIQTSSTKAIKQYMKDATALFTNEIDPIVYSLTDEELYVEKFKSARSIIDLGHKFTQFKGTTVNKKTGLELSDVQIEVIGKDGELIVNSDLEGKYRLRLDPDIYALRATHPNFEPFEIDAVKIQPGEIKVENFEMVPKV